MTNVFKLIASVACALTLAACGGGGSSNTGTTTVPQPAFAAVNCTDGGGTVAANGNLVTVQYTGYLYSETAAEHKGTQFETSRSTDPTKPDSPIAFKLGVGAYIVGWDKGIVGMKVGGKCTLIIPADMAYGAVARTSNTGVAIPANSALVFDVELVAVN